jgi:hypothetical protein
VRLAAVGAECKPEGAEQVAGDGDQWE